MTTTRRLAAILAADVAGYSRLMDADELLALKAGINAARAVHALFRTTALQQYDGLSLIRGRR